MTLQVEAVGPRIPPGKDRSRAERFCGALAALGGHRAAVAWLSLLFVAVAAPWIYAAAQSQNGRVDAEIARAPRLAGSAHSRGVSAESRRFVGSWRLVSFEGRSPDGRVVHPMGEQPSGQLIYDATGQVSVQYMRRGRPQFASGDLHQGTPEEIKAAFEGYIGYWGTYDVDAKAKIVTHHVIGAAFPNWVEGDQRRFYSFDHNHLTFRTPPILIGGVQTTNVIVWERVE
jgi:Lipocalin-like domain